MGVVQEDGTVRKTVKAVKGKDEKVEKKPEKVISKEKKENDTAPALTKKRPSEVDAIPTTKKAKVSETAVVPFGSQEDVDAYRKEHQITLTPETMAYKPLQTFEEADFPQDIMDYCKDFAKPTPIQSQCWPIIAARQDLIGISQTGSGKTITFLFPSIVRMRQSPPQKHPFMLIMAPTRELVLQIQSVCSKFAPTGLRSVSVYGGTGRREQRKALLNGTQVVVATPGRLIDFLQEGVITLSELKVLVLDEADTMLDMGFEPDIRKIVEQIPHNRQTLLFSATWPKKIQALASEFLQKPIRVTIGEVSTQLTSNKNVEQIVQVVNPYEKPVIISQLLKKYHTSPSQKIIIFVLRKVDAKMFVNF
jgi:superfamily II DNA/RNA helicase